MSEQSRIKFGIAGLGNIAATHARAINGLSRAEVAAACSRSEQNRNTFAHQFDVPVYSGYHEFLNHSNLDVVTICTPSGTHLDYGKLAAEAGKHVVVEKPIEVTVKRGKELIECCRQNGVKLAVIYQNRFIDGAVQMKKALDNGILGDPVMVRAAVKWYRDQEYYTSSEWRGTLKLDGGGAVINQAIHTLDLLVWMMGEVESVSALKDTLTHPGIEAEDNAVAVLKFKNGAMGVFEASTSVTPAQPRIVEINGTRATALLTDDRVEIKPTETNEKSVRSNKSSGAESPLSGLATGPHQKQYEQITDAFLTDGEPVVSGEESLRSLALAEAIYRSSEHQKFVSPVTLVSGYW